MNKVEYLQALKEALKDTDKEIMNEIMADYEEHFQAGLENGKTEEQICEELGSIDDLVEEIKEVYQKEDKSDEKKDSSTKNKKGTYHFKFDQFRFDDINGEMIGDAINSAFSSAGEAISEIDVKAIGRTVKSTLDQAASAFGSFADSCMNGTVHDDYGSQNTRKAEGTCENVTRSYGNGETDVADISEKENAKEEKIPMNLVVDGTIADVIIRNSKDGKLNLSYENNGTQRQKQMYEFYSFQEGDCVYAGVRKVGKSVFVMNFGERCITLTVELPIDMESVRIKTASGNMELKDCTIKKLSMVTASGKIQVEESTVEDGLLKSVSAPIDVKKIKGTKLKVQSTSGNVRTRDMQLKNTFLKSVSGMVEVGDTKVDIMECSSLSGNVELSHVSVSESKVRSTSGSICGNDFTLNNADIGTVSGEISLSKINGEGLRLNTTSGDISLDGSIEKCFAGSKSGNIDIQTKGDIMLESKNTSGNIDIHLGNEGNGYRASSQTTSGRLYINYGDEQSNRLKSGIYTYGNETSELTLSSVSGDIHIRD